MNRVVITGMGIWSCLGKTLDEVRDSLYEGRSGIVFDPERKEIGFRSALTGKVEVPDLKKELSRSQRVFMPQQAKFAYCATRDAIRDAGVDEEYLASNEVGLLYGNDSSALPVIESVDIIREKKDTMMCGSGTRFAVGNRRFLPMPSPWQTVPLMRCGCPRKRAARSTSPASTSERI